MPNMGRKRKLQTTKSHLKRTGYTQQVLELSLMGQKPVISTTENAKVAAS